MLAYCTTVSPLIPYNNSLLRLFEGNLSKLTALILSCYLIISLICLLHIHITTTNSYKMQTKNGTVIHKDFWHEHLVEVIDNGIFRTLFFGGNILQSQMSKRQPHHLLIPYTCTMMAALLCKPNPQRVLLVGVGAGSLIRFLQHHFPECHIDAVDHSPHIIDLARGYFRLPENDFVTIHCCDGLEFVRNVQESNTYDLILVDAFNEQGMATDIYTLEFFGLCANILSANGIVSSNLWSGKQEEYAEAISAITRTCKEHITISVTELGNVITLSFKTAVPWQKIDRPKAELRQLSQRFGFDMQAIVKTAKKTNIALGSRLASFFS